MHVVLAGSAEDVARCYPALSQLRTHIDREEFLRRVELQQREGYRLAYVEREGEVSAVAGFRVIESMGRGRFLQVEDLVTEEMVRSEGYGEVLFTWLCDHARSLGCERVELDAGVHRGEAHRFFCRQRMQISAHHFTLPLLP